MIEVDGALVAGPVPRRWSRLVVSVALTLIALAVVGMHQLSLGHVLVTTAEHGHAGHAHAAGSSLHTIGSYEAATTQPAAGPEAATDDGCVGCSDHTLGPGTCVLALTLLVLVWWLRLPRPRSMPPLGRPPRRRGTALTRRRPRRHALSLPELSVLRT